MPNDSEKKAAPGWYVDKRWPGEQRRWDGTRWLDDWRPAPKSPPETWLFLGAILALVGGILTAICFSVSETAGWIAVGVTAAVAGTILNIGAMGKAVEIGVRASRS